MTAIGAEPPSEQAFGLAGQGGERTLAVVAQGDQNVQ